MNFTDEELAAMRVAVKKSDDINSTFLNLRDIYNLLGAAKRIAERLPTAEDALMPATKLEDIRDVLRVFVDVMNQRGLGVTIGLEGVE